MKWLSTNEIRKKWLDFFKKEGHLVLPSASLIPKNDQSLLWINSGVATLKPYFSGLIQPPAKRLTNCQKCIRTNDIENVGITSRHHTFFEMLGNFSIGDYFKKEAIGMAYKLLFNVFEFDKNNIFITVYENDDEAYEYWIDLGINSDHIIKGNRDRNFWDVGNGPCGSCTEIYYDRGSKYDVQKQGFNLLLNDIENDRYVEIWNIVFSQFNNDGKNNYSELFMKNIDTGAGLERLACIIQEVPTDFDTDLFQPTIDALNKHSSKYHYNTNAYFSNDKIQKWVNQQFIIIVDHLKASIFAISDGALPTPKERGAVIRKLLRRAFVSAWQLEISNNFLFDAILSIIDSVKAFYPNLDTQKENIIKIIEKERKLFFDTFEKGIKLFEKIKNQKQITGANIFKLTDTYGFPYEVIKVMCDKWNISYNEYEYFNLLKKHQESSHHKGNIKAMMEQNKNLVSFDLPSHFDYENNVLLNVRIVAIFDKKFNEIKELKNNEGYLVFDNTVFYATSGGQIHDIGTIIINETSYDVIDVIKAPNGQHLHLIKCNSKPTKINDLANLSIDKNYRLNVMRNHSSEHLLQKALQTTISNNIHQQGASKTEQKLTFDFSYTNKLTEQDLLKVENVVNKYIASNTNVLTKFMNLEEAKKFGAQAHFENVYKKIKGKLRVVIMGDITSEVCGGTHVQNLSNIEAFLITKFENKGGGMYRIEAITGNAHVNAFIKNAIDEIKNKLDQYYTTIQLKHLNEPQFVNILNQLSFTYTRENYHFLKDKIKEIDQLYFEIIKKNSHLEKQNKIENVISTFENDLSKQIIYKTFENYDNKTLSSALTSLTKKYQNKTFVSFNKLKDNVSYIVASGINVDNEHNATTIISQINKILLGVGGGSKNFSQGGSKDINAPTKLNSFK